MTGLTYDTGALIAAERNDRRMWLVHERALRRGVSPTIPAAVLVEAWRGSPAMARLLTGATVEPLDVGQARRAGLLLGRSPGAGAVDAVAVEGALRRNDSVVTSDRDDLVRLADGVGRRLDVISV